jgi:hypothetical protein
LLEAVGVACWEVEEVLGVVGEGATLTGALVVAGSGVEVAGSGVGVVGLPVVGVGVEAVGVDEGSSSQSPSSLPPVGTGSPLLHVTPAGIWH